MKTTYRWAALAAALLLPLAACDEGGINGSESASVNVLLTDAPGDVEAAFVTVSEVRLVAAGSEDEETDAEGSIIVLSDVAWTGDLLELQNDVEALVQNESVPAGRYTQLRLVISGGCIEVETESGSEIYTSSSSYDACGSTEGAGTLQMPSFGQSGLKINLPSAESDFEGEETLLLDFDVSQSFGKQAGGSGRWVMSPVIKATSFEAAATVNVSLSLGAGMQEALTAAGVTMTDLALRLDEEDPVTLASDGSASFGFVSSGSHTLTLVGPEGWVFTTSPASPFTFVTTAGATQELTLTLSGVTAGS